jgi:hypothetical protein
LSLWLLSPKGICFSHLPLLVFAVILNAAKDPGTVHSPIPPAPSNPEPRQFSPQNCTLPGAPFIAPLSHAMGAELKPHPNVPPTSRQNTSQCIQIRLRQLRARPTRARSRQIRNRSLIHPIRLLHAARVVLPSHRRAVRRRCVQRTRRGSAPATRSAVAGAAFEAALGAVATAARAGTAGFAELALTELIAEILEML